MNRVVSFLRPSNLSSIRAHSTCCGENRSMTVAEKQMSELIRNRIKDCSRVEVHDVSNGCGSMFHVLVNAASFKGKSKVAQHKEITAILRDQIKDMHGLTIETKSS